MAGLMCTCLPNRGDPIRDPGCPAHKAKDKLKKEAAMANLKKGGVETVADLITTLHECRLIEEVHIDAVTRVVSMWASNATSDMVSCADGAREILAARRAAILGRGGDGNG